MKTIIYLLVALILSGILLTGFSIQKSKRISYQLQSTNEKITVDELRRSAEILKYRLKRFTGSDVSVATHPEENRIEVSIPERYASGLPDELLTGRGRLAFYETIDINARLSEIQPDNKLYSLLNKAGLNENSAVVGRALPKDVAAVDQYLDDSGLRKNLLFAWSQNPEDGEFLLFALKPDSDNGCILRGTDVKQVGSLQDLGETAVTIRIHFNQDAIQKWAQASHRNLHQPLAIVLDGKVFAAPVVQSEMNDGRIELTGTFEKNAVNYFVALAGSGELPSGFTRIR